MRVLALLALVVSALVAPAAGQRLTADQIARRVQDRDTGRDSRAALRMKLFDRRGRARERALTLLTLKGRQQQGDRLIIRFTYPFDALGWPAVALPCGAAEHGLPASVQLVAPTGADALVLGAGAALERALLSARDLR